MSEFSLRPRLSVLPVMLLLLPTTGALAEVNPPIQLPNGTIQVRDDFEDREPPPPGPPEAQGSAAVAAYQNNCDPAFAPSLLASLPPPDERTVRQYTNQLLVRYRASCTAFYSEQVSPVVAAQSARAVIDSSQEIARNESVRATVREAAEANAPLDDGPEGLDDPAGLAAGFWLYLTTQSAVHECRTDPQLDAELVAYDALARGMLDRATVSDLDRLAVGYARGLMRWGSVAAIPRADCQRLLIEYHLMAMWSVDSAIIDFDPK